LTFLRQHSEFSIGLNYNYFRDLDPQTGRYVESDPIGLDGGSMSTYTYVNDDPLDYIDPEGLAGSGAPRRRVRDCNSDEWTQCEAQCAGKGVRSCKRQQLFQPVRTTNRNGTVLTNWVWKDQGLSCDCKDPEACKNAIKNAAAALGISVPLYLIISEGSRLFPPRNLVPVP
jgi:RHS repeat-associated protein